jgi:AAA-like domain
VKPPLRFATRNLLFGQQPSDVWALYRLEMESYEGLTDQQKRDLLAVIATFAYGVEADFTMLRVSRRWSVEDYLARARAGLDRRHGLADLWDAQLDGHRELLGDQSIVRPELYLSVRLAQPRKGALDAFAASFGEAVSHPLRSLKQLGRAAGLADSKALSERALRELAAREERAYQRVCDYFYAERATTLDLQWLVRRSFCRGLGEPGLDLRFRPQALVLLEGDELQYRPLEADVLRLFESPIYKGYRHLEIHSELGISHQALYTLGALPETVSFPGPQAELLFAPLEALGFPVDAVFSARYVPNSQATALVRRKVVDADNIFGEESTGDHGPSPEAARRPHAARALEEYLTGEGRPPLLEATVGFALGAPSAEELEARGQRLEREFGSITLHRPAGEQLNLFVEHFPGQGTQVRDYADYLLVEQLGAMMPLATHAVGSDRGPYIGHTLSGSRQPVLFDLTEASRTNRPPATLLAGTLGSGKTMCLQLLLYYAFLRGSRVVDIDPKGDHKLHLLPGMEGQVETIELAADPRFRGLLDPLRIAPADTAEDLATSFLIDVLPQPVPPEWRTEIRGAVKTVVTTAAAAGALAHCGLVVDELARGNEEARRVARALAIYADTGLAQLGFADAEHAPQLAGHKPVTSLRIRNLPRPLPGTPRADLSEEERIGQALMRLLAAYAMHLMGGDKARHKVMGFDEAWFLLEDAPGRRLIEHLNRWGRSEFATPILVTHLISDAEELDNLIGARFMFGFESDPEAQAALRVLRLDPDDQRLRQRLLAYREGRCLLRDLDGRVGAIRIEPPPDVLAALGTTPIEDDDRYRPVAEAA